jgi:hypothetical protein
MIPLDVVFWGLVGLFGLIGALRGWAKEVMVAFSVILALFIQQVFGQYVFRGPEGYLPILVTVSETAVAPEVYSNTQFFACAALLLLLAFFGYSGPTLVRSLAPKVVREKLQDVLLGFFLGLINGYLIVGTLWFYLDKTDYSLISGMSGPLEGSAAWRIAQDYLLPIWLSPSMLFVGIALAFVFVIIVFV